MITFRGTTLSYFKDYGINTIEDLLSLKGNYFMDRGFISTSLKESDCFYNKQYYGQINNIKIKYLLPEGFKDGLYLNNNLSYYYGKNSENEYLINSSNIGYLKDVKTGNNTAEQIILMIPKYIYDNYYKHKKELEEKTILK